MADWTRVDFAQAAAPVLLPAAMPKKPKPQPVAFVKKTHAEKAKAAADKRKANGLLIKPGGLQRGEHPCTSEVDYSEDETEFMMAIEKYKREHRRPFPTNREILRVFLTLGYRKVAEPVQGGTGHVEEDDRGRAEEAMGRDPAGVLG